MGNLNTKYVFLKNCESTEMICAHPCGNSHSIVAKFSEVMINDCQYLHTVKEVDLVGIRFHHFLSICKQYIISVTSDKRLRLAEFRDEYAWPQLQLGSFWF